MEILYKSHNRVGLHIVKLKKATFRVCAVKNYMQQMSTTHKILNAFLLNLDIVLEQIFCQLVYKQNILKFGWKFFMLNIKD